MRFRVSNKTVIFPEMEIKLMEWFGKKGAEGCCISGTELRRQAMKIF